LRVAHVTSWLSSSGGGVSTVVQQLSHAQQTSGLEVKVFGLADSSWPREHKSGWAGADVVACSTIGPTAFGFSPALKKKLIEFDPDVLHCHGIWMAPTLSARSAQSAINECIRIVAPHGMLDPWALSQSKLKKEIAAQLFERAALRSAQFVQALCDSEAKSILSFEPQINVRVVPNGVEQIRCEPPTRPATIGITKTILFLGRLHSKKNIHGLLDAWKAAEADRSGWELKIAGWGDDEYVSLLEAKVRELGIHESVKLCGPVFGSVKEQTYLSSHAFVLPSFSEGLPMAALEAMSYGLPCLLSSECNIPDAFAAGAAMQISTDPQILAQELGKFLLKYDDLMRPMSIAGIRLVERSFKWSAVVSELTALYREYSPRLV